MNFRSRPSLVPAVLALSFSGCASVAQRPAVPAASAPVLTASAPLTQPPVFPAVYKRYYVGLVSDSPTSRFARPPGEFLVRESDERWNAAAADATTAVGPTLGYQSSAFHPDPVPGEMQAALSQASRTIATLAAENTRLRNELAAEPAPTASVAAEPAPATAPSTPSTTAPAVAEPAALPPVAPPARATPPAESPLVSFTPAADNTIEVTSEFASHAVGTPRIPFEQVYFPTPTMTEVKFRVSVVVPGPASTAVINHSIYAPGDTLPEGFELLSVDEDGVWLRRTFFRVRVPFQDRPVTVRFPQET